MDDKFPILTFVSGLFRIIGWLIVCSGVGFAIIAGLTQPALSGHSIENKVKIEIAIGIGCAVIGFVVVALGEIVQVLFAIEKNTRAIEHLQAKSSAKGL